MFADGDARAHRDRSLPSIAGGYPWPRARDGLRRRRRRRDAARRDPARAAGAARRARRRARRARRGRGATSSEAGVRDRVELSEGDMFERVDARGRRLPAQGRPARLGRRALRRRSCAPSARRCRAGARVVLVETLQERERARPDRLARRRPHAHPVRRRAAALGRRAARAAARRRPAAGRGAPHRRAGARRGRRALAAAVLGRRHAVVHAERLGELRGLAVADAVGDLADGVAVAG